MSAHALMNLLNESSKRDELRVLSNILSLFHNELNTEARILNLS